MTQTRTVLPKLPRRRKKRIRRKDDRSTPVMVFLHHGPEQVSPVGAYETLAIACRNLGLKATNQTSHYLAHKSAYIYAGAARYHIIPMPKSHEELTSESWERGRMLAERRSLVGEAHTLLNVKSLSKASIGTLRRIIRELATPDPTPTE